MDRETCTAIAIDYKTQLGWMSERYSPENEALAVACYESTKLVGTTVCLSRRFMRVIGDRFYIEWRTDDHVIAVSEGSLK